MKYIGMRTVTLFLMILIFLSGTGMTPPGKTYRCECISIDTGNEVVVKIWKIRKGHKYKEQQAGKDALHTILFSGLGANANCSASQKPLLSNETDRNSFNKIQKNFFKNKGDWSMFIRNSANVVAQSSSNNSKEIKTYNITISRIELRKYLEEKNIIKPLGKIF